MFNNSNIPQDIINASLANGSTALMDRLTPSQINQGLVSRNRASEYLWRATAMKDGLVKSILSAHLINAIGVKDTERPNVSILIDRDEVEIKDDGFIDFLNDEALAVSKMLNRKLAFIAKDALGLGDGYLSIRGVKGKGITDVLYNLGCKPWHIVPFRANIKDEDVGYLINGVFYDAIENNRPNQEVFVGRLNLTDGSLELQEYTDSFQDTYNPFATKLSYYADSIHGGLLEGQKEAYEKFVGSINSSYARKIASSIIERYISVAMNHSTREERDVLKKTVAKMAQITDKHRKGKVEDSDATPSIVTHIVPTTSDSANGGLDIQESSLEFSDDGDFNLSTAKRLIGGMKFHHEFTTFSDAREGERSPDSLARTSEQMEEVGGSLRDGVTALYKSVMNAHFSLLGGQIPKGDIWKVQFNAVTVQSKKEMEYDRVENLNNTAQYLDLISSIKDLGMKRDETTERVAKAFLKDSIPLNIINKDDYLEDILDLIFMEEGEPDDLG